MRTLLSLSASSSFDGSVFARLRAGSPLLVGFLRGWFEKEEEERLRNGFCLGFDCKGLRVPVALKDMSDRFWLQKGGCESLVSSHRR